MRQCPYTTAEDVVKRFDYVFRAGRPGKCDNGVIPSDSVDPQVELIDRLGRPYGLMVRVLVDPDRLNYFEHRQELLHRIRVATLKFLTDDWNW